MSSRGGIYDVKASSAVRVARFFPRPAYYYGLFHAALDDDAQAFYWLDKAYERRDECILYIKVDPGRSACQSCDAPRVR